MTTLALEKMTLQEKLAAMEAIWENLSRTPEAVESPAWHKDLLEERQQQFADGMARYTPWPAAKPNIRRRCSADSCSTTTENVSLLRKPSC
jgi:hypothetical protein